MHVFVNKVITMVIGAPGSGKSTLSAKIVEEANKKGICVYCNYPVLGACEVDMDTVFGKDLGKAVFLVDEAALQHNSRRSKDFGPDKHHWIATTRHRDTQVIYFVQNWTRLDVILRELSTEVIKVKKWPLGFSCCSHYDSDVILVEDSNGYAREFASVFKRVGTTIFWRPRYYHMFDSYAKDFEYEPMVPVPYDPEMFPPKAPLWRRVCSVLPLVRRLVPVAAQAAPALAAEGDVEALPEAVDMQDSA